MQIFPDNIYIYIFDFMETIQNVVSPTHFFDLLHTLYG